MAKTYAEKLKHPKWQKRRLEILERDRFECQDCGDTETTLHIHHKIYRKNAEPWDYKDSELVTLCENCHAGESESLKKAPETLINSFKKSPFLTRNWIDIQEGVENCVIFYAPEVTACAIKWFLQDEESMYLLKEMYFDYLHKKNQSNG